MLKARRCASATSSRNSGGKRTSTSGPQPRMKRTRPRPEATRISMVVASSGSVFAPVELGATSNGATLDPVATALGSDAFALARSMREGMAPKRGCPGARGFRYRGEWSWCSRQSGSPVHVVRSLARSHFQNILGSRQSGSPVHVVSVASSEQQRNDRHLLGKIAVMRHGELRES